MQFHFMNAHEHGDAIVVDFVNHGEFSLDARTVEERAELFTRGRLCRAIVQPRPIHGPA